MSYGSVVIASTSIEFNFHHEDVIRYTLDVEASALYGARLANGTSQKTSKGQTIKKYNNDVTN